MATERLPPVIPSIARAKNNISIGRMMTKVPSKGRSILKTFSAGENNAKRNNTQPIDVHELLKRRTFFLPCVSDHLPRIGAPIS